MITTPYTFAATAEVIRYFDAKPVFVDVDPLTLNLNLNLVEPAISGRTKGILPVHIAGYPADMDGIFAIARKHGIAVIEDAAHMDPLQYGKWSDCAPQKGASSDVVGLNAEIGSQPARRSEFYVGGKSSRLSGIPAYTEKVPAGRSAGWDPPQDFGDESRLSGISAAWEPPQEAASRGLRSTAVCFSFYATKTITTGEGGMICTDDDAIADRCRIMALHGISRDAWKRYTAEGNWYYEITAPGYKYNMTDVAAAMGLAQLRKAERMLQRRRHIAAAYTNAFSQIPNLQPPTSSNSHAWHLYMLRLNLETLQIDRARFIEELKARNIGASVHFIPLHVHPYYGEAYGYKPEDFPVAYREYMREISLPIYSKMTDGDVEDVIAAVLEIVGKYAS